MFRVLHGLICLLECDLLSSHARLAALSVLFESKQTFINPKLLDNLAKDNIEKVRLVDNIFY